MNLVTGHGLRFVIEVCREIIIGGLGSGSVGKVHVSVRTQIQCPAPVWQ